LRMSNRFIFFLRAVSVMTADGLTSLPVPADVEQVALGPNGLIEGMRPDTAFFDMSTNSVAVVRKINAAFAEKNLYMLDSPVSGGPSGAASGKMAIWVGGDKAAFDQYKAVLDAMGDRPAYIGQIGSATVAKLVHNMSGYAIVCALAETFTLGVKAGMDPLTLWQAVRQGAVGRRFTFDALIDQFLPGEYDPPAFALKLAHKDVSLANALGRELGMPMRLCNLTLAEMTEALARGWGGRDSRVVMLLQQERAGEQPRGVDCEVPLQGQRQQRQHERRRRQRPAGLELAKRRPEQRRLELPAMGIEPDRRGHDRVERFAASGDDRARVDGRHALPPTSSNSSCH